MTGRPVPLARAALLLGPMAATILTFLGCGRRIPASTAVPVDDCRVGTAPDVVPDSLVVLVTGDVRRQAGRTPDPAVRFVAAQAYETLVRVDCAGRIVPGLAVFWTRGAAATTFELRTDATFWSGQPVTAHDVIAAWSAAARADTASMAARLANGATAIDARRLQVTLAPVDLAVLADPSLVVSRPADAGGIPEGTGPYRLSEQPGTGLANGAVVTLRLEPIVPGAVPRLVVHSARGTAARDLVDAEVDLVITDDPGLTRYATTTPGMVSRALPWDRTYLLLVPDTAIEWSHLTDPVARRQRDALARDVVRRDARGTDVDGWLAPDACTRPPIASLESSGTRDPAVVFLDGDAVAQALAERVAAVSAMRRRGSPDGRPSMTLPPFAEPLTARGMPAATFGRAIAQGTAQVFVIGVPFGAFRSCAGWASLLRAAPWVAPGGAAAPATPSHVLGAMVPLVDTRWQAVVRDGHGTWVMDWAGAVRLTMDTPAAGGRR